MGHLRVLYGEVDFLIRNLRRGVGREGIVELAYSPKEYPSENRGGHRGGTTPRESWDRGRRDTERRCPIRNTSRNGATIQTGRLGVYRDQAFLDIWSWEVKETNNLRCVEMNFQESGSWHASGQRHKASTAPGESPVSNILVWR